MNFQPLFTTARVVTAIYRVASTTLLLIYLAQRVKDGRKLSRGRRAVLYGNERIDGAYRD